MDAKERQEEESKEAEDTDAVNHLESHHSRGCIGRPRTSRTPCKNTSSIGYPRDYPEGKLRRLMMQTTTGHLLKRCDALRGL